MPYTPQTWVDNNASYPLSAARMNTIESGISTAASVADQGHRILTTVQRDALTGVTAGTMIYNTTAQQMQIYIGTGWIPIGAPLVFTNEAARDAAITSPSEGMSAYLTAPTIPAGTGATITGVKTIYNGTNWVCVTPIGGIVNTSNDIAGASSYADLGTPGPVVTMVTGTSVIITLSAQTLNNVSGNTTSMAPAVSGATTISAATVAGSFGLASQYFSTSNINTGKAATIFLTGLTAGTNTFTAKYANTNNTGRWFSRNMTVTALT
jgi:hypothetical protein